MEQSKEIQRPSDLDIEAQRTSDPAPPPGIRDPEGKRNRSLEPMAPTVVPPLGVLPVPTTGPPLLVTDSWHRANKSLSTPEIPTPPSQESSSDSVFTDPENAAMVAENEITKVDKTLLYGQYSEDKKEIIQEFKSPFSLSRHKKIELSPAFTRIGKTKNNINIIMT